MLFGNKNSEMRFLPEKLLINGVEFDVFIKEGKGQSISAKINNGAMFIRIPKRLNKKEKLAAAQRIKVKLVKKLEKLDQTELNALKLKKFLIKENSTISILGKTFTVMVKYSDTQRIRTKIKGSVLEIKIPNSFKDKNNEDIISRTAKKALSKEFIPYLQNLIESINNVHYNFHYNKLKIHHQNGLWGSYSRSTRNIHLNFKLLFAPEEIIRYVIIHELSHIRFSNHDENFWQNVSLACQDYKEKRRWLRKNGNTLGYF